MLHESSVRKVRKFRRLTVRRVMALGATLYVFKIDLADSDRGVYQP
jgi:hypothetical protein